MSKADSIKDIRFKLRKICDITDELMENLTKLHDSVHNGSFIPETLNQKMTDGLRSISQLQTEIFQEYASLEIGDLPDYIEEMETVLSEYQKKLEEQERYQEAVRFFFSLHSDNKEIEDLLDARKEQLKQVSSIRDTESLLPYLLVKQVFEETDMQKKFTLMYQLPQFFEEAIFTGIGCGKIMPSAEKEFDADTDVKGGEARISDIPEETEDNAPDLISEETAATLVSEDETEDEWNELGIENPSLVCYKEQPELLTKKDSPKAKDKFGVSRFKGDMKKQLCLHKLDCLIEAVNGSIYTKESMAINHNQQEGFFDLATDKLYQMGYLTRYYVNGMEEFYTLSSRGEKAFSTKESFSFIKDLTPGLESNPLSGREEIEDTTNAAISRILLSDCYKKIILIDPSYTFSKRKLFVLNDAFILTLPLVKDELTVFFVGIVTERIDTFRDIRTNIKKISESYTPDFLIVIEPDRDMASNIADWIETFSSITTTVGYCVYHEDDMFDITGAPLEVRSFDEADMEDETDDCEFFLEENETDDCEFFPEEDEAGVFEIHDDIEEDVPDDIGENVPDEKKEVLEASGQTMLPVYLEMLASGQYYAAAAYLKALSNESPSYQSVYRQAAYALNDPMENCSYNSNTVMDVYTIPISDYFLLSAVIRTYFYDQFNYDYSLPQLQATVSRNSVLKEFRFVEEILYMLFEFKMTYHTGMDRYADYRKKDQNVFESSMEQIRHEAKGYLDNYCSGFQKENASHKRFIETYRLILGPKSDLCEYLKAVSEDNREMLEMLEDFLSENYVKDKASICEENIDPNKIDCALDRFWDKATNNIRLLKRSSDLLSSLRMNLFKKVQKVVSVLCSYVFLCRSRVSIQDDPASTVYKKHREPLLEKIGHAVESLASDASDTWVLAGRKVLAETLLEIRARISGEYVNNRYFYIDFLKNDKILLDDSFLPVLEEVRELPAFSVTERILHHCEEPSDKSWEDRIDDIYRSEDNYGSAELIFKYVKDRGIPFKNLEEQMEVKDTAMKYPQSDMENKRREFIEDLELAQSYGQIDNSRVNAKEVILQVMESWFEWAKETANYGFFSKILEAFMDRIHEGAKAREKELDDELRVYLSKNEKNIESVSSVVTQIMDRIRQQNYAAAEDLLNRLIRNDLETDDFLQQEDYLADFLNEFSVNYQKTANSGVTLKSLLSSYRSNKDTKGGNKLLENWMKGNGLGEGRLLVLLNTLGFNVDYIKTEPRIHGKIESYLVMLKKSLNGRKSNYKHPISAFGSEAETKGFRIVCLYGKTDASRLIDTFKEIGNAKNTLVLLDYALSLADRRILARKTKTDLSGKIFAVLDRVALLYLAKHYSETAVNRMLMFIIMPFASYQPYIDQSAAVMPPELFIGRREELEKIESPTGVNLVYGGRQLGKTALLRMAQKDVDKNENGDRAVIVDVHDKDYHEAAEAVSAVLYDEGILKKENITDDWGILARDIKNRLRDTKEPIPYFLLLLDEADRFIESSEAVNYQPFDALKDIQGIGSGKFKFVVAGLRNIIRFKKSSVLKNNNSLVHLDSLTIKPFKAMEARELLEVPLSYLGFRFPKDSETEVLISTIFGTTNYFPGLLQLYCTKMIETMKRDYAGYSESETPPYYVRKEHIKKVLAEQSLQNDIYNKFSITLKIGNDDFYYIIALLVAYHYHNDKSSSGCDARKLLELADTYCIKKLTALGEEKIDALMEEMCELNVLQHTGDGRYRFARHSFCQMMGTPEHIDNELEKYMED